MLNASSKGYIAMQTQHPAEGLDIKIGSTVQCRDGRAGRVIKLVVDPASKRVTHIVVERGVLLHHDVVVPIERVERVEGDVVVLDVNADELNALPEYKEIDYAVPDAGWAEQHGYPPTDTLVGPLVAAPDGGRLEPAWSAFMVVGHTHTGIPDTETPIGRGTRVSYRHGSEDEPLGRLDHVLVDPRSGRVRALVVRKGLVLSKDVIVPVEWVKAVGEDEIVLAADREQLEKLPEYRPMHSDAEITDAVRRALASDSRTRDEQNIDVHTAEGVVHLGGSVSTEDAKRAAGEVARSVSGVWEVDNGLTVESAIATAVSEALARDPRTSQAVIDVTYLAGSVTLRGQVRTPREKAAAVEIARSMPGVVTVIDELEVRADAERKRWPSPDEERVLAAAGFANTVKRQ